jgi:L-ascorbate metabolism protein UlaG (beta-lactamase superfamily)
MTRTKVIALGTIILGMLGAGAGTQGFGQMLGWKQMSNNNRVLQFQKGGGSPTDAGDVQIAFYGHSAVAITSPKGLTLLVDPWRNDPSGAWGLWYKIEFPKTKVDIGMSTHAHFDHDALDRLEAIMLLDRMAGAFSLADVRITGIADKHVCNAVGKIRWTDVVKEFGMEPCPPDNPTHMDNNLYLIETGGLRILVWGDNRPDAADDVWARIGSVDIAFLPVDGSGHILTGEQADTIMKRLDAKVVIPIHYLVKPIAYSLTTLEPAIDWVKQHEHQMLDKPEITLSPASIKNKKGVVIYFGDRNKAAS